MGQKAMQPLPEACQDVRPVDPMTEEQAAGWLIALGATVDEFRGHFWTVRALTHGGRGTWTPINEVQPLPARAIGWPRVDALSYWAVVDDPAAAQSSIGVVTFDDLAHFGADRIHVDRRRSVRKGMGAFEFQILTSPEILLEQGWDLATQATALSGAVVEADRATFTGNLTKRFDADPQVVVAAIRDGRLAAYLTAHVIDETAICNRIFLHPEFRHAQVGSGLYWVALRHLARTPEIQRATFGLSYPDLPSLELFKYHMGATVIDHPVRSSARPGLAWRWRRTNPYLYMRTGGHDPRIREELSARFEAEHGPVPRRASISPTA